MNRCNKRTHEVNTAWVLIMCVAMVIGSAMMVGLPHANGDGNMRMSPSMNRLSELFIPEKGCVPDEATAIKIAEAVLLPVYGKDVLAAQRPFRAELLGDSVWAVAGTLPRKYTMGGVAYIEILKKDGCILGMGHGK